MLSICIPTYEQNGVGAKHLKQLLTTIPYQYLNTDDEIIISDNSEDDVIENMVRELVRPHIKYFRYDIKGVAHNTNHAIDRASGDIIKIMFMDDYFLNENALLLFQSALQNGHHWAISNSVWVDDEDKPIKQFDAKFSERIIRGLNTVGMPSVIAFKKTDIRFDAGFKTIVDKEFYYQLFLQYGPPAHIPEPVIAQRIHKNSLSAKQGNQQQKDLKMLNHKHPPVGHGLLHKMRGLPTSSRAIKSYKTLCITPSDINEHLPLLKEIAMQCEHVTEFGVRDVVSTYAFIEGTPKQIISYDIKKTLHIMAAQKLAGTMGVNLKYVIRDTLKFEIAATDFLFIDTLHNYEQLKKELNLHAHKVRKFIGFHDVTSFGLKDETKSDGPVQGLLPAILEFMMQNPQWQVYRYHQFNNGCLILKRDE